MFKKIGRVICLLVSAILLFPILQLEPTAHAATQCMYVSTNEVKINNPDDGEVAIITVTLADEAADADTFLTYTIEPDSQNVISAEWSLDWYGNMLPLVIIPHNNGQVQMTITNSYNDEVEKITIIVTGMGEHDTTKTEGVAAVPTDNPIYRNGQLVNNIPVYNIADSNYFKLRDIGYLMDFGVQWNSAKQCVEINTKAHSDGLQVSNGKATQQKTALLSTQPIYIDGVLHTDMTVYQIDGNNYFKLRDLARNVDFGCIYDSSVDAVRIDNRYHYAPNDTFGAIKNEKGYRYYEKYPHIMDFGAFTGATLYSEDSRENSGTIYTYNGNFSESKVDEYKDWLTENGFHYMGYNAQASAYVYVGTEYYIFMNYVPNTGSQYFMLGVFNL